MKISTTIIPIAVAILFISLSSPLFAAPFLKYEGLDGESLSKSRPMENITFTYSKLEVKRKQLWLIQKNGSRKRLTKDGVYRSSEGELFVLRNGLIVKKQRTGKRGTASGLPTGKRQHKPFLINESSDNSGRVKPKSQKHQVPSIEEEDIGTR